MQTHVHNKNHTQRKTSWYTLTQDPTLVYCFCHQIYVFHMLFIFNNINAICNYVVIWTILLIDLQINNIHITKEDKRALFWTVIEFAINKSQGVIITLPVKVRAWHWFQAIFKHVWWHGRTRQVHNTLQFNEALQAYRLPCSWPICPNIKHYFLNDVCAWFNCFALCLCQVSSYKCDPLTNLRFVHVFVMHNFSIIRLWIGPHEKFKNN